MQNRFIALLFSAIALISLAGIAPAADQNFTRVSYSQERVPVGERLNMIVQRARKGPTYAQAACGPAGGATCAAGEYCCHFNQLNQYGCCKDVAHCCSDGCCQ